MPTINHSRAHAALHLLTIAVRGETLDRLHQVIESEIAASAKRIEEAAENNGDFAEMVTGEECEAVEHLLGVAFVTGQWFINSIRTEIAFLAKTLEAQFGSKLTFVTDAKAHNILALAPKISPTDTFSTVEAINAIANYWKHSEEWPIELVASGQWQGPVWSLSSMRGNEKRTVEIATSLGLRPNSSGNFRRGAGAIGITEFDDLKQMRQALRDWACDLKLRAYNDLGITPSTIRN